MSAARGSSTSPFEGTGQRGSGGPGVPTDLELMLYVDGELEETRAQEVEAYLDASAAARQKVLALRLGRDMVHETALERGGDKADGIADAVMARITSGAVTKEEGPNRAPVAVPKNDEPANDNARRIFGLAALAVAAAAGLMLWGRLDSTMTGTIASSSPETTIVQRDTSSDSPPVAPPTANAVSPDSDGEVGVEVAAVDFGSQAGAIFYVASDAPAAGHSTTVVWVGDDFGGGQ